MDGTVTFGHKLIIPAKKKKVRAKEYNPNHAKHYTPSQFASLLVGFPGFIYCLACKHFVNASRISLTHSLI